MLEGSAKVFRPKAFLNLLCIANIMARWQLNLSGERRNIRVIQLSKRAIDLSVQQAVFHEEHHPGQEILYIGIASSFDCWKIPGK